MGEEAVFPDRADRWESIYEQRPVDQVSWYQPSPEASLRLIEALGLPLDAAIIDVGGGASSLVDHLLADGYSDVTVLDISSAALQATRDRIGEIRSATLIHADLLTWRPTRRYALWHDRAVFHFLVVPAERAVYLETLGHALAQTGAAIVGTFAIDGPKKCSGLPVARYEADDLGSVLGSGFEVTETLRELHKTPAGIEQPFTWVTARRRSDYLATTRTERPLFADMDLVAFVRFALPPPPSSVLEVGCGAGHLALALDAGGYRVIAIDPEAPDGEIFRRTTLEELGETGPFDAAVATYALHHIESLDPAVGRIADLLTRDGKLVVQEFGWDRVDRATADWYRRQQPGLSSAESVLVEWEAEHEGLHGYEEMQRAFDGHFRQDFFEWRPYLYRCLERDNVERSERAAIKRGDIQAVGFRYVGTRL